MPICKPAALLCAWAVLANGQTIERKLQLGAAATPVDIQEMFTTLRTVLQFRDVAAADVPGAILVRGTPAQIAAAEWLLHDLEEPAEIRSRDAHRFTMPGDKDAVIRALYLHGSDPRHVQEMLTVVRAVGEIQFAFNLTRYSVLLLRGPQAQIDRAAWMIEDLENNAAAAGSWSGIHQFRSPSGTDDTVRIFYPEHKDRPEFASVVKPLQSQTGVRAFLTSTPEAFVIRGKAEDIARAEKRIGVR